MSNASYARSDYSKTSDKELYDCPFTLRIDGRTYNHSKISVFEPQDVFDKIKNELAPYFENFLN